MWLFRYLFHQLTQLTPFVYGVLTILGMVWNFAYAGEIGIHGFSEGYLETIEEESLQGGVPVVIEEEKAGLGDEKPLKKGWMTPGFSQQITNHYEQEFGYIYSEGSLVIYDRFSQRVYRHGVPLSLEEDMDWQRQFGDKTLRRLFEYQVNGYLTSNPRGRQLYYLKERISSLHVETEEGYTFRAQYYLGSRAEVQLKLKRNPQFRSRFVIQMSENPWVLLQVKDTVFNLGYQITSRFGLDLFYSLQGEGILACGRV